MLFRLVLKVVRQTYFTFQRFVRSKVPHFRNVNDVETPFGYDMPLDLFLDAEQLIKIEEKPDEYIDYSSSVRSKDSDIDTFQQFLILVFRF